MVDQKWKKDRLALSTHARQVTPALGHPILLTSMVTAVFEISVYVASPLLSWKEAELMTRMDQWAMEDPGREKESDLMEESGQKVAQAFSSLEESCG